jgi:adenylate kinase
MAKQRPNVLVTGTPGTGKSTTCEQISEATGLQYVDVGSIVKSQELHSGWDDEFSCYIIDEDKVAHAHVVFLRHSFLQPGF